MLESLNGIHLKEGKKYHHVRWNDRISLAIFQ